MAKLSLYLPGSMCFIFWWSHCDRVYDMFKKYRIPTSRDIIFFYVRILSPSIYIFVFYNLHPHHLSFSLSLSITRVKGMLAKESSLVTVLHYSTMLSSSSLSLSQRNNSHYTHDLYIPRSHNSIALNVVLITRL